MYNIYNNIRMDRIVHYIALMLVVLIYYNIYVIVLLYSIIRYIHVYNTYVFVLSPNVIKSIRNEHFAVDLLYACFCIFWTSSYFQIFHKLLSIRRLPVNYFSRIILISDTSNDCGSKKNPRS